VIAVKLPDVHVPEEQAAVPERGPTDQLTVAMSPAAVPQLPPIDVTFAAVEYGNVRTEPFTLVTVTVGGVVSLEPTVAVCELLVAVHECHFAVTV
jgi:hypothetical protein